MDNEFEDDVMEEFEEDLVTPVVNARPTKDILSFKRSMDKIKESYKRFLSGNGSFRKIG